MKMSLVICARVQDAQERGFSIPPGFILLSCLGCQERIVLSPSSLRLVQEKGYLFFCDHCQEFPEELPPLQPEALEDLQRAMQWQKTQKN